MKELSRIAMVSFGDNDIIVSSGGNETALLPFD